MSAADIRRTAVVNLGLAELKSPPTVMTVYQQADQKTMRNALTNRDQRRAASSR